MKHTQPINGAPSAFIAAFDTGQKVEPFAFGLSLPHWILRPEVRAQLMNAFEAQLELAHEGKDERDAEELARLEAAHAEVVERIQSKCGLTRAEEFEQAAMRG